MIPFDIVYVRPGTVREAADAYRQLDADGQAPVYYGGGSELISMARLGNAAFGAVIDLKSIPECRVLETDGDSLLLGSAVTLGELVRSGLFPLLGKTAGRIADRTMQNRITLGGNLAATIIYRETVLPLLLSDAALTTAGIGGLSTQQVSRLFRERLMLPKGDFMGPGGRRPAVCRGAVFSCKENKKRKDRLSAADRGRPCRRGRSPDRLLRAGGVSLQGRGGGKAAERRKARR